MNLSIALPPEALAEIVAIVKAEVVAELRDSATQGRWLTGAKAAADYLGCTERRVYNRLHRTPRRDSPASRTNATAAA
jgi:hypothetical protein